LLVYSGAHSSSVEKKVSQLDTYLIKNESSLADLAYTLSLRREHMQYRTFNIVSKGISATEAPPPVKSPLISPQLNFIFTGQGSQWPGMGRELMKDFPNFLANIRQMDRTLMLSQHPPSWTIENEILGTNIPESEQNSRMEKAEISQPICTAIQIGLVNLLDGWGIKPKAVLGHSSGEIAAAYAAKAITMEQAILTAYYRGQVTKFNTGETPGGMLAVGLGRAAVTPYLLEGTVIACENGPQSVTLSGDLNKIETVMGKIKEANPDALVRKLFVEMAYHSAHMEQFGARYQEFIQDQAGKFGEDVYFYSSISGQMMSPTSKLDSSYWRRNLESPVLFYSAMKKMLDENAKGQLFLEIGPHSTLQGPIRQIFKESGRKNLSYCATMSRKGNSAVDILNAVGQLYVNAISVDFQTMHSGRVLSDLPTYSWHYDAEYWDESRQSREWRFSKFPHHDLLGARVFQASDLEPMWRNLLRLDDVPWIRDHQIGQDIIFPGAGYLAMAGEAIRQITEFEDFSLRHVTFSAAMMMKERATEILTRFRPVRLTNTLDSVWFEFAIFSHNGISWVKHCTGEARGGADSMLCRIDTRIPALPRQMSPSRCYEALAKLGLNYGSRFRGLSKINASTTEYAAVASMNNEVGSNESLYQLHPSTIDLCFQVTAVAITQGLSRKSNQLVVPSYISGIYIRRPEVGDEMQMYLKAEKSSRGFITSQGFAVAPDGKVIISFVGAKQSPLENPGSAMDNIDRHAAAQINWLPDHTFVPARDLIKVAKKADRTLFFVIEKLTLLAILESDHMLRGLEPAGEHLRSFHRWISQVSDRARNGQHDTLKDAQTLSCLSSTERQTLILELSKASYGTEIAVGCEAITRILKVVREIVAGTQDTLTILLEDDILKSIYDYTERWDLKPYFCSLSHLKPDLKILEIGAGTGGTTSVVLESLISSYGERMFYQYTYTDISAGFFVGAKERFGDVNHMKYQVLDISQDPIEQGFEESSYDLIIAANVLHATPSLHQTLANVKKLLHPRGTLFLQELCCVTKGINYIMGPLPGWFVGEADDRADQPYVHPDRWVSELAAAGFAENSVVVVDDDAPFQTAAHILAHLKPDEPEQSDARRITVLRDSADGQFLKVVKDTFASAGYIVDECVLQQTPPPNQDIISLLDIDGPFLNNISEARYYAFLRFVQNLGSSAMIWVTKPCQVECTDPRYAQILGLARTLRNEFAVELVTLELEDLTSGSKILQVFEKFKGRDKNARFNPDYEYAISDGVILLPRFHWISIDDKLASSPSLDGPKRLGIGKLGFLNTLQWKDVSSHEIVEDQLEIKVRAVGLNFRVCYHSICYL
jgi:acyl transferase domain-containing protein